VLVGLCALTNFLCFWTSCLRHDFLFFLQAASKCSVQSEDSSDIPSPLTSLPPSLTTFVSAIWPEAQTVWVGRFSASLANMRRAASIMGLGLCVQKRLTLKRIEWRFLVVILVPLCIVILVPLCIVILVPLCIVILVPLCIVILVPLVSWRQLPLPFLIPNAVPLPYSMQSIACIKQRLGQGGIYCVWPVSLYREPSTQTMTHCLHSGPPVSI